MASSATAMAAEPRRILIVHGDHGSEMTPLFLEHPKHRAKVQYLASGGNIFELQKVECAIGSWFVGDAVEPDGDLYVASRVDPVFLMLPDLLKARRKGREGAGMFVQLDQIATRGSALQAVISRVENGAALLEAVCEAKMGWDEKVYRISDAKLMSWLGAKVSRICAECPHFANDRARTVHAVGLLSEYLPDEQLQQLIEHQKLTRTDIFPKKRKRSRWQDESVHGEREDAGAMTSAPAQGKPRADPEELRKKRQKLRDKQKRDDARKEKARKAAAGTKSIMSFFARKPSKKAKK